MQVACLQAGLLAAMGDCFTHSTYVYIMYLRNEDTIFAIMCMGLPFTTTVAGEWL